MDILLTGASGFIGRNFILRAPEDWRILAIYNHDPDFSNFVRGLNRSNITPMRCDLTDAAAVATMLREHGTEWESCLYLAGKVDIPFSVREPKQDLALNTGPLLNLLDGIRAKKFVYFSSGAVYDGMKGEARPDAQIAPTLPYAISKLACERYVQFYHARRRSIDEYLVVRFFGAYGPFEASHKIYTRLIKAFDLEHKNSYTIYGDGRNLIDAMYVDDAIDAIQRMLTGGHWNDIVNLASGRPVTIEALVCEVAETLGLSSVRVDKEGVAHENIEFWASTGEMRSHYDFSARIPVSVGISRLRDFLRLG